MPAVHLLIPQDTIKSWLLWNQGKGVSRGLWGDHSITPEYKHLQPGTSQCWLPTAVLTPHRWYTLARISQLLFVKTWLKYSKLGWTVQLSQTPCCKTIFYSKLFLMCWKPQLFPKAQHPECPWMRTKSQLSSSCRTSLFRLKTNKFVLWIQRKKTIAPLSSLFMADERINGTTSPVLSTKAQENFRLFCWSSAKSK